MEWYYVWWPWLTYKRVARFLSASAELLVIIDIYFYHCFMCLYGCGLSTFIKLPSNLIWSVLLPTMTMDVDIWIEATWQRDSEWNLVATRDSYCCWRLERCFVAVEIRCRWVLVGGTAEVQSTWFSHHYIGYSQRSKPILLFLVWKGFQ